MPYLRDKEKMAGWWNYDVPTMDELPHDFFFGTMMPTPIYALKARLYAPYTR